MLIFDWHGTLVDTHDAMFSAMEEMLPQLEELGLVERLLPEDQCRTQDDARLVRKVIDDPGAVAILGYNFLERNLDRLRGASIDGVMPVFERIESGEYPIARPLYLYVKKAHLGMLPDLAGFVRSLGTPAAWGEEGYLVDKGLIPMPVAERRRWAPHAALGEDSCSYPACP